MHRPIFGRSFAVLVAPILLSVLAFNFLNKKKTSVRKNVKDADAATSGSLTAPKETDSDGSSSFPTKTNNGASCSSTTSTGNYYEVFLNFRGHDTRRGFTDHLYNGLVDAGISVFKDDNELRQGEKIGPDLLTAIKNSKILIPIISVNYGQSRWCLDELVQIIECKKSNMGYTVLPIFYKVEPSQVRYQKGNFGKAFRTRSKNFDSTTMEKWKQALEEVSSLKGFDANGYEGELVKSVVQQVLFELKKKFELLIPKNLVGIDCQVKKVMKFVDDISSASLFVGIHGMGGIGKTTLAKIIYNKLSNQFEHRSFIANVRERCDDRRLVYLQNQLIKDILKLENEVSSNDEGIQLISSKFNGKKVLILLDDVSNDDQLKALAGNHNWFSSGSVIIITTRNKSILDNAGVDNQYALEQLDKDNSLILFSRHAFRRDSPPSEFEDLTRDVVSTTGGLPLSLEVLGSFLCGKSRKLWGEAIKKLRKVPHKRVQQKLRISYDELTHEQKQIFLDIACFFINTDKIIASYMWDACDFFPEQGIEVLRFLSLIKVGDDHKLLMHDQLRDLGREIIREENYSEPWNRSRLWDSKDVLEVLEGNKGTNKIEAIRLGLYDGSESCTTKTFKDLTNLRFLQVDNLNLIGDFQNLLPRLRWLAWDGYHLHFELTNFHLKKLVVLNLSCSEISNDWAGFGPLKMATELKVLNLSHCALRTTHDLSAFKGLEILMLEYCYALEEIHPAIKDIKTLVSLHVNYCRKLKELPQEVGKMEELRELLIHYIGIEELPESIGSLKKLETLDVFDCESLARIPNSIGNLASLRRLDLIRCHKLVQFPDSIGSLMSLWWLSLSGCILLRQIPDSIGKLTSLTELHLQSMAIEELPESIGSLKELKTLDVCDCTSLARIPNSIVLLKHPKTLAADNSAMDYQIVDFKHALERSRPFGISDEVNNLMVNILPVSYNCPSLGQSSYSSNDLPRNVVITLSQGSLVKSMDFHQVKQILLLVGTNTGDVIVWEVGSGARIALRKFNIWDLGTCSMALQASLANDYTASVNRVMWSPDGILFGVAYSKHMVHIYSYHGGDDMRNHLEIEAHVGSVNDLAFSNPSKQLCFVTCGEDKTIKVWDAMTGAKLLAFEGHEAPVYSICPHNRENIQYIFSTATDGKIKGWLYDNMVSRVDWDAPGHSSTVMAYNADGTRLFLCGTNKEGESYLVEWNESEGAVKRTYHGLRKRSGGVVQFDTTKNKFLAVGDEFMVKFWDMDNNNILISVDADGGLPASPCIRFNKEGNLLAVSTSDNSIKILANADGMRLLRIADNRPFDASRITPRPLMKDSESMADVKPGIADDSGDKSRNWKLTEINETSQCRSIRLPDNSTAMKVPRLSYTNSGRAILALSSNAVHKLWKWEESDQNLTGRATTSVVPQLWPPPGGNLMTNDTCANPEDAVQCFALSEDDSKLISASGGEISWFDMKTFQTLGNFTPSPPPNNDIIEIGMEDSAIQIYSAQDDEIHKKLKRHRRIIKGFTFSTSLKVLVSSGADSQMMITFLPHPPPTTFLAFTPRNNSVIAIGMEDSSIQIFGTSFHECKANLKGCQKRITGLAFSNVLNVLVSSGADSQLCVWNTGGWEKQASKFLQMPNGQGAAPFADTRVQFHVDQIHLLVVHQTQISTCEAPKLDRLKQWDTREASAPITDATYSCNGESIYVSFEDGSIRVLFASTLRLICCINPTAYIFPIPSLRVYPLVIAAHPSEPNQFALGLTDGSVYVLEPLESEGEWGGSPPIENGVGPSTTSSAIGSDQPQR